jgi:putative ABC transport system permease protein
MRKSLIILFNSLQLTILELKVNKLRSMLSLTGIAFGIFCIIGVLATVKSLEYNIRNNIKNTMGSNTIYIDKWDYGGEAQIPFWKMKARPIAKYEEINLIKDRSELIDDIAFLIDGNCVIGYKDDVLQNAIVYGITEAQSKVQPLHFMSGRYISPSEFANGSAVVLIGNDNAEKIFGNADRALNKIIELKGKKTRIIGVIQKQGTNGQGWNYDNCVMLPYKFCRQIIDEKNANPLLIVKGKENVSTDALKSELKGIMRRIRRLSPTEEDNFSLNSVDSFDKIFSALFGFLTFVGSIIGSISLIVGMFGIANIMFVTVKERTGMIGIKKAVGAKRNNILFEFLMEAFLLCLLGGIIGLILVYILSLILTQYFDFPVFISVPIIVTTVIICLVISILAGMVPASRAAKMDPVVAIRG